MKSINIHGKEYLTVNERLIYFSENYPNGSIVTELVSDNDGKVIIKAIITPDVTDPTRGFTGYACEREDSSYINKTSYIENCETSAIGRALGIMGIGIDTSLVSAEEVANAIHQQNSLVSLQKELVKLIGDNIEKADSLKKELNITNNVQNMTESELKKMIDKAKGGA
jgi:hypothetical protein